APFAYITAPTGYQYGWSVPPPGNQVPIGPYQTLLISNPIANSVYTVTLVNGNYCYSTITYTLVPSAVSINAIGTTSSCIGGSSGSATVYSSGSSSGYSYTWTNSTNSVVGTSSVVSALSPGSYTVSVSGGLCGTATAITTIGTASTTAEMQVLKLYCNIPATMCPNGVG